MTERQKRIFAVLIRSTLKQDPTFDWLPYATEAERSDLWAELEELEKPEENI